MFCLQQNISQHLFHLIMVIQIYFFKTNLLLFYHDSHYSTSKVEYGATMLAPNESNIFLSLCWTKLLAGHDE